MQWGIWPKLLLQIINVVRDVRLEIESWRILILQSYICKEEILGNSSPKNINTIKQQYLDEALLLPNQIMKIGVPISREVSTSKLNLTQHIANSTLFTCSTLFITTTESKPPTKRNLTLRRLTTKHTKNTGDCRDIHIQTWQQDIISQLTTTILQSQVTRWNTVMSIHEMLEVRYGWGWINMDGDGRVSNRFDQ